MSGRMDSLFKAKLMALVRDTIRESMETEREVWITGEQLTEQFGMFSKGWLKEYGDRLPRMRAAVMGDDGVEHRSGWAYPRNRIARMVKDGSILML